MKSPSPVNEDAEIRSKRFVNKISRNPALKYKSSGNPSSCSLLPIRF